MGTKGKYDGLSTALFGKTRRAVLGLLYLHSERSYYVREIVRATGAGQGAVQRELRNLADAGILQCERRGRQVHYRANENCPVFEELRSLMLKTAGLGDLLRQALEPLSNKIRLAFLYGSMATGDMDAASDVDLMVVGEVGFGELVAQLQDAQEKLRREINPTVYSPAEFSKKLAADHPFLHRVMESPKTFLIGDEDELGAVGK